MKLQVIIHKAEEGGYWAEVPALPGCVSQGDTYPELIQNIQEAVEACLETNIKAPKDKNTEILELAV